MFLLTHFILIISDVCRASGQTASAAQAPVYSNGGMATVTKGRGVVTQMYLILHKVVVMQQAP